MQLNGYNIPLDYYMLKVVEISCLIYDEQLILFSCKNVCVCVLFLKNYDAHYYYFDIPVKYAHFHIA